MSGGTTTQQAQTQQSSTQPYAPAQPMLSSILGQLGTASTAPTSAQTAATGTVSSEASGVPDYSSAGEGAVSNLFNSSTTPQQNTLTSAYNQVQGALSPMLNANYTNPATNPELAPELAGLNSQITNQVNSQFAGAGRPAGTNAESGEALALGLSEGEAPVLANEYNSLVGQQQNAAGELESAAGSTASGVTQQQQVPLQNAVQGIQAASAIPGLATEPGTTQLTAANLEAGLPTANLANLEGLTVPIAGLGAQSTGSSTGTTTQQSPWYTTALGAGLGGLGLLGSLGGSGGVSAGASAVGGGLSSMLGSLGPLALLSDERVKDDIEPIGMLYDDTPVFSYKYKGDPTPRIGLIAQDIETRRPDAVIEIGGIKAVDYGKATERARRIGMLAELDMAA